jgi:hypothetical protein
VNIGLILFSPLRRASADFACQWEVAILLGVPDVGVEDSVMGGER